MKITIPDFLVINRPPGLAEGIEIYEENEEIFIYFRSTSGHEFLYNWNTEEMCVDGEVIDEDLKSAMEDEHDIFPGCGAPELRGFTFQTLAKLILDMSITELETIRDRRFD